MSDFREIVMIPYDTPLRRRLESRRYCGPYTRTPTEPGQGRGFYQSSRGLEVDKHGSTFRLRLEKAGMHVASGRLRRGGYSTSAGDCFVPIIARLPRRRGFLAGWTLGEGMCGSLEPEIYNEAREAANRAYDAAMDAATREEDNLYNAAEEDLS